MDLELLTSYINRFRSRKIYNLFSKEMKSTFTYRQFKKVFKQYYKLSSKNNTYNDYRYNNVGEVIWIDLNHRKGIQMILNDNEIEAMTMLPLIEYSDDELVSKKRYIMPVEEEFYVFWGGNNELLNYHYSNQTQRYAYDLIIMKEGKSFNSNGEDLENYYCYNSKVIAPNSGEVIAIEYSIKDNIIGVTDTYNDLGNYIMIKHDEREYSLIAHLKYKSIIIKEGDWVEKGDLVGFVGNSGNSTEPHIHFQLMDNKNLSIAKALRIRFDNGIDYKKGDIINEFHNYNESTVRR